MKKIDTCSVSHQVVDGTHQIINYQFVITEISLYRIIFIFFFCKCVTFPFSPQNTACLDLNSSYHHKYDGM